MVQQEENHKSMMTARDVKTESVGAFVVSHISRPSAMQGERLICKHYEKLGHEEATCFELVGYPPRWTVRGGKGGRGRNRGGQGGERSSIGRGQGREAANAAQVHTELGVLSRSSTPLLQPGLPLNRWKGSLVLLRHLSPGTKSCQVNKLGYLTLALHVIWQVFLKELCDVCNMESIPVELPNGSLTMATKQWSVQLNPNIKLRHLLYVPRSKLQLNFYCAIN